MKGFRVLSVVLVILMALNLSVFASQRNLALEGTVIEVNGTKIGEQNVVNLIDGNLTTKWCSQPADIDESVELKDWDGVAPDYWAIIDLGENKSVTGYTLYQAPGNSDLLDRPLYVTKSWILQYQTDGGAWVSADTVEDYVDIEEYSFDFPEAAPARYIRILVMKADQLATESEISTLRIPELEVYGDELPAGVLIAQPEVSAPSQSEPVETAPQTSDAGLLSAVIIMAASAALLMKKRK